MRKLFIGLTLLTSLSSFANTSIFINFDKITATACMSGFEDGLVEYHESQSKATVSKANSSNPLKYTLDLLSKRLEKKGYAIVEIEDRADIVADVTAQMEFCPGYGSFENTFEIEATFRNVSTGETHTSFGRSIKTLLPLLGSAGISYNEAVKELVSGIAKAQKK